MISSSYDDQVTETPADRAEWEWDRDRRDGARLDREAWESECGRDEVCS